MINNTRAKMMLKNEYLWNIALTTFFTINMNYYWSKITVVWYGSVLLVLLSYVIAYNGRFHKHLPSFFKWMLSFIGLCTVSLVWSISASTGFDVIKNLIVLFVLLLLIQFSINYKYSVNTLLTCYFIATLVNMVYVFSVIDISKLGDIQLGTYIIEGWNGNGIGFMMAQGAMVGFYLFGKHKGGFKKLFFLFGMGAISYMVICTGSRTAFIMLVAGFIMYSWLAHPTKMVRNIIVTVLILCCVFYLIMNVESFYKVLGSRFEGLFALFSGEGKVDGSANIRNVFIQNGKKWFLEEPIIGYGINNYKELNRMALGRFTYAHNTFIELAVDLGILGLIWYYSVYVYLGWKLLVNVKGKKLNAFLFSWLIASFISQYGTVSYYDFYQNFLLMLCFYAVTHTNKKGVGA